MMKIMTRRELIERPNPTRRSHVVLLGAGASRAALPHGDRASKPIPLMNDLVERLGLRHLVEGMGPIERRNFEVVYSKLAANPRHEQTRREVERRVTEYFSLLELPEEPTIYDRLLLSLRPGDAVFTFNWDPFLFDAHIRNRNVAELPGIFFLHGNVRIGVCSTHIENWGPRQLLCPKCGVAFNDIPLLYPVEKKGYSSDPYIAESWKNARWFFKEAFLLTIFGYSGPDSDRDAVDLLKNAWMARSDRTFEHVEVVDIAPKEDLEDRWSRFTPTHHLHIRRDYHESFIARCPRRSSEAVGYTMRTGMPRPDFPLPETDDLKELQDQVRNIAKSEA